MDETTNFKLKKPASEDYYNVQDFNDNMDILDEEVKKALDKDIFNHLTVGTRESGAIGDNSTSIGQNNLVSGTFSVAEGSGNKAVAPSSHAEGMFSVAAESGAHSEGYYTQALGQYSHAENTNNIAATENTHVEGKSNLASFGTLFIITGFDNAAKKLTLDSVSSLAVGDKIDIQATDLKGFSAISINAIDTTTKTITLDTSLGITSSWKYCVKRSTVTAAPIHAEGSNNIAVGASSHVEGNGNVASGSSAHAEGTNNSSSGHSSHTEGYTNTASGAYAHAEGSNTKATGASSHAEGGSASAEGSYSHAEGASTKAIGNYSHAEGDKAIASGVTSHAEGNLTNATGTGSHAEGIETNAIGLRSHSEGWRTVANGITTHAEGSESIAASDYGHVEGAWNLVSVGYATRISTFNNTAKTITVDDTSYITPGVHLDIKRDGLPLIDVLVTAVSGLVITLSTTETINSTWTFAINRGVYTGGSPAHAEGQNNLATGLYSHVEGGSSVAIGNYSHAEGNANRTWGHYSHAEGVQTSSVGAASHAEGDRTNSYGIASHTEGVLTVATGDYSHAGGNGSASTGIASFAHGSYVEAAGDNQAVVGRYNVASATDLFQVGNGTSNSARSNALRVASNGALIPTAIVGSVTPNPSYANNSGMGCSYRVVAGVMYLHIEINTVTSLSQSPLITGLPIPSQPVHGSSPTWLSLSSTDFLFYYFSGGTIYVNAPASKTYAFDIAYPVV
jgi:trimeric autotransporter adhesin